jgi:hypothetical protein
MLLAEAAEQILDLARPEIGPGVIERDRAVQTALRSLEP